MSKRAEIYENIIIGGGAAGLYCACALAAAQDYNTLILEKTARPGTKLLMSGSGQCNITHGGSIKDFISCYGEHGRQIRGILQKHSNLALEKFMAELGVRLVEREDGKIFPASMKSRDVLEALIKRISRAGMEIRYNRPVSGIIPLGDSKGFAVASGSSRIMCRNLIVATGGCSYPATGSDGRMFDVLAGDLGMEIVKPVPALTPIYVENYRYGKLQGISFKDASLSVRGKTYVGDLLFTAKNLSGPLILNSSRYLTAGARFTINFAAPASGPEIIARFKREFPGNGKSPQNYLSDDLGLPKRFVQELLSQQSIAGEKVSRLTGGEIKALAAALTAADFTVSGPAGFREAMATKGGVSLSELKLTDMSSKKYGGLYVIGEAADIDGDTGGYNLQFAFSSAMAAARSVSGQNP